MERSANIQENGICWIWSGRNRPTGWNKYFPETINSFCKTFCSRQRIGAPLCERGQWSESRIDQTLVEFEQGSNQKIPYEYYERYNAKLSPSDKEINKLFVGRDWFGKGWPYISDVHTPTFEALANANWSPFIQFWRNSQHGNIYTYKPANLKVLLPAKPLSKSEIEAAKAEAPQQGNGNIGHIVLNVQSPGNGMQLPGLGLAAGADSDFCVPVVDESLFVTNRDYWIYMRDGWGYFKTHYDEPSKQLWLMNTFDYMQDYLKPRSEANHSIRMNDSIKKYTWKKE